MMLNQVAGFMVLSSLTFGSHAELIYVDDDAPNDPGPGSPLVSDPLEDGSLEHPFDAIQEAIDVSFDGDTISLAGGVYVGIGNRAINFGGREIAVTGESDQVIIDLSQTSHGFIFDSGERSATRLESLLIRNGRGSTSGLALRCSNGSSLSVVNCVFRGHELTDANGGAVHLSEDSNVQFTGCSFDNNIASVASGEEEDLHGGAIYMDLSTALFEDCVFASNSTESSAGKGTGGALSLMNSSVSLIDCQFRSNKSRGARGLGGAVYSTWTDLELTRCSFTSNEASEGGALALNGLPVVATDCDFLSNVAAGPCTASGGAVGGATNAGASFQNCRFEANRAVGDGICGGTAAGMGGAFQLTGATFHECEFLNNQAVAVSDTGVSSGGAGRSDNTFRYCVFRGNEAHVGGALSGGGPTRIESCLFYENIAVPSPGGNAGVFGAVRSTGDSALILNSTFIANTAEPGSLGTPFGGGLFGDEDMEISNCIVRGNSPDQYAGSPVVTFSNVEGGPLINGNIDTDPQFVNARLGDYRLAAASPCIDAASSLITLSDLDLDGNPRSVDDPATPDTGAGESPHPDMGAYEFQPSKAACLADLNKSGAVDFPDILAIIGTWGSCAGCPEDLDGDGAVGVFDLLIVLNNWGPCP